MKKSEPEQAREVPLADLCLSIARSYRRSSSQVSGGLMAQLVKRLIDAESQPGGPYYGTAGKLDFPTNLAIGYLFTCLGKPLPNVDTFIAAHRQFPHDASVAKLLRQYDTIRARPSKKTPASSSAHRTVFAAAKKQLSSLQQPERSLAYAFLTKLQQSTAAQEIALLPTLFATSLLAKSGTLPLQQLGEANIFCWLAYSIYDKLLDDEPTAKYLPVANIAMRLALQKYQALFPQNHPFQHTILSTFTTMDHANAWEVTNCRFKREGGSITIPSLPRYGSNAILAKRSVGHVLGPLAVCALTQLPASSITTIEKGLHHFLIARQLSDDIHDWKDDFQAGHASSVVAYILRRLGIQPDTYNEESLLAEMQHDFWHYSMEAVNTTILRHLRLSRMYFLKSKYIKKDGELFTLLAQLEHSAQKSTDIHTSYQDFLAAY